MKTSVFTTFMKKSFCCLLLLPLLLFANSAVNAQSSVITLETLLTEMTDRGSLARFPDPYYTTRQFSSYDRNSVEPGDSTWFANWDRTQFIRKEENNGRKEYVMMDTEGPGAVVRFWMTFAGDGGGEGTMRIYFDGEEEPAIEGSAFDVLSGGLLVDEPLSASVSKKNDYEIRGHNLYLPLPYARQCKITYESDNIKNIGGKGEGESVYYNINYREYEDGTQVETFTHEALSEADELLQKVQQNLRQKDKEAEIESIPTESGSFSETLADDDSYTITIEGPAAIRKLSANLSAEDEKQALRSTIVEFSFDGNRTVWAPLGDFFGTGYQYRSSDTWYTNVSEEGVLSAYWIMPFEKEAKLTFRNLGKQEVQLNMDYATSDWSWDDRSMHFGSTWHQYTDLYTGEKKDMYGRGDPFDINYTHLKGKGVLIGDVLTLFNTAYSWWGEGDEKIYIDGEDFPSHFGTGTEDYYGYAWVRPEKFTKHPFISQPDGSGNITPGYTVNKRYRSLDAVPFKEELVFDMEMWHWTKTVIDYAPTTFFYLRPGSESLTEPDVEGAKEPVTLKRSDIIPPRIKDGRLEMEDTIIDTILGGNPQFQYLYATQISNDKQLWWRNVEKGDVMKVKFISDTEGEYETEAQFVIAPDYGTVRIKFNGETILEEFNGYHDSISTKKLDLGKLAVKEGENEFTIEILKKHPEEEHAMIGWDYVDFKGL